MNLAFYIPYLFFIGSIAGWNGCAFICVFGEVSAHYAEITGRAKGSIWVAW